MVLLGLVLSSVVVGGAILVWRHCQSEDFYFSVVGFVLAFVIVAFMAYLYSPLFVHEEGTFSNVGSAVTVTGGGNSDIIIRRHLNAEHLDQRANIGDEWNYQNPVRVRDWFPETLAWQPQLITDDQGRYSLPIDLADSITTWRLSVSGVTADGRLGAAQETLNVFQSFFVDMNLPIALTRGDETSVSVVVSNYLDKPQTVRLVLDDAVWFERLGKAVGTLELGPRQVKSLAFPIRVIKVGQQSLKVTARTAEVADSVKRDIEVVPDGRLVEKVVNGSLHQPAELSVTVPADAIDGSTKTLLKLYPSSFSQVVEGLDGIFQMPHGCFEQTSSTTYPNVLALDYLNRSGKSVPEVKAKAKQYIHLGYQRLLSFEVKDGGFDWFGRPPANRTLTAYGLMEFRDMARVHDVDPDLIRRTRQWLLQQRNADGSWTPEGHALHEDPTGGDRLTTTAYIAWAVYQDQKKDDAGTTRDFLLLHRAERIDDPYTLALIGNALMALDSTDAAEPYLDRLASLRHESDDGQFVSWQRSASQRTMFHGAGRGGHVETTALAVLALLKAKHAPGATSRALAWLIKEKDAHGTWHSTQATVLALKALLAGTNAARDADKERVVIVSWKTGRQEVKIRPDQAEVMRFINLSEHLTVGRNDLTIREVNNAPISYQLTSRHHVPDSDRNKQEPLTITINYDRTEVKVRDTITATARIENHMKQTAPMIMLDLPIPAGFRFQAEANEAVAKVQLTPRTAIVYLRELRPGQPLTLKYRLTATAPGKVMATAGRVYEYYDSDKQGTSPPATLTVKE
jgi:uncharacterized protein YfaS (alpha-2-macroglobulin family)